MPEIGSLIVSVKYTCEMWRMVGGVILKFAIKRSGNFIGAVNCWYCDLICLKVEGKIKGSAGLVGY